jgi:DinB superfamily
MTGPAESARPGRTGGVTLDDLRRQRGEGWQWARAQTDRCPQCGHHPAAMERDTLGAQLMESAQSWRNFLMEADDPYLRTAPAPGIFSPAQYGAHVRDILRVYGDRILIMLEEDDPVFPQFNPDEGTWDRYNRLGRKELADDLEAQAQRLATILDELEPEQWSLTMIRNGGADGVYTFTVAGLASYAVHEAHHHLLDADGSLAPTITPTQD